MRKKSANDADVWPMPPGNDLPPEVDEALRRLGCEVLAEPVPDKLLAVLRTPVPPKQDEGD